MKNIELEMTDGNLLEKMGFEIYLEPESKDAGGNVHGYYKLLFDGAEIVNGGTDKDMYDDKCSKEDFAEFCFDMLSTDTIAMVTNGDPCIINTDDEMIDFVNLKCAASSVTDVSEEDDEEQEHALSVLGISSSERSRWGKIYKVTCINPNECGYFSIRK